MEVLRMGRFISYLAWVAALSIAGLWLWEQMGTELVDQLNAAGLLIQLLGVFSILLVLSGAKKFSQRYSRLNSMLEQAIKSLLIDDSHAKDSRFRLIVVFLAKLSLFGLVNLLVIYLAGVFGVTERVDFLVVFGLVLAFNFLCIWIIMLGLIFWSLDREPKSILKPLYELCDYVYSLTLTILLLTGCLFICDFTHFLSRLSRLEMFGLISTPLFIAGTSMQWVSALL